MAIGDGHDLRAAGLAGDETLEAVYDGERTLRLGSRGEAVRKLQFALIRTGFDLPEYGPDGVYGRETKTAVERFQRSAGFGDEAVDGIVGEDTMERLDRQLTGGLVREVPNERLAGDASTLRSWATRFQSFTLTDADRRLLAAPLYERLRATGRTYGLDSEQVRALFDAFLDGEYEETLRNAWSWTPSESGYRAIYQSLVTFTTGTHRVDLQQALSAARAAERARIFEAEQFSRRFLDSVAMPPASAIPADVREYVEEELANRLETVSVGGVLLGQFVPGETLDAAAAAFVAGRPWEGVSHLYGAVSATTNLLSLAEVVIPVVESFLWWSAAAGTLGFVTVMLTGPAIAYELNRAADEGERIGLATRYAFEYADELAGLVFGTAVHVDADVAARSTLLFGRTDVDRLARVIRAGHDDARLLWMSWETDADTNARKLRTHFGDETTFRDAVARAMERRLALG